jgi:hypothetical protein
MSELVFYLIAGLSAVLFFVGFMGKRKAACYGTAVFLVLVIAIWSFVAPTTGRPDQSVGHLEPAHPTEPASNPAIMAAPKFDDDLLASLSEQTMSCNSSAQAAIAKAASIDEQPEAALADAKSAAETCRRAGDKIRRNVAADNGMKDAIQSCGKAMSDRGEAMASLANLMDGISTQEDSGQYKARQNQALQSDFLCQSTLQALRDMQQIMAMEAENSAAN